MQGNGQTGVILLIGKHQSAVYSSFHVIVLRCAITRNPFIETMFLQRKKVNEEYNES